MKLNRRAICNRGIAYLFHGSSTGLSATPVWRITGENPSDEFGYSVAGAGDVNGDGYADVLVAAHGYAGLRGKVYLYHGSADGLSPTSNWSTEGENSGDNFGVSIASAGDVNGDGYADVAIGADLHDLNRGKVYIYSGSALGLSGNPYLAILGQHLYDRFGSSVAPAGDVNGDGYCDLLVGAIDAAIYSGEAYLYLGSAKGLVASPAWDGRGGQGVTRRSFPNNGAHKDFPGCFRCHDGKHLNDKGQAIRLQCNLCHNLPEVEREGGPAPVAPTVAPGIRQPPSHLEPNFMHDHRFHLDASCSGCHGKTEFGWSGSSFCANPACHGRKWPGVNLNVADR